MVSPNPYTAGGYQVLKVETHLHTLHSDGQDGVAAMFEACRVAGYDAVALTDHNTVSGLDEAAEVAHRLGLIFLPGVEVTTFRGHAVVLGVSRVPEWRDLEVRGMDALARDVSAEGGLVCVAHPSALGSPVCSGCAWDWPVEPTSVDLWEIFSSPRPTAEVSLALWRQLLARGGHAAPVAPGDVHAVAAAARAKIATYVYARERSASNVLDALRQRRVFASAGRQLEFWLENDAGDVAMMGDSVEGDRWRPYVTTDGSTVETVELLDRGRCMYAEVRDGQGRLEAISAPIWIDTPHRSDTSVCALSVSTQAPAGSGPATRPGDADSRPSDSR